MRIKTKDDRRQRIKHRIRKRVQGHEARPRLKETQHPFIDRLLEALARP